MADSIYTDVTNVIGAGGYDLADLLHRIDVLYAGGRLTDAEREDLYELARTGADPDDSLPDVTERVGALELRVAALEQGTYQPSEPEGDPEWPEWVRPTSKDTQYHKGDKVTFEGAHYVCNKNNVVTSPAEDQKSWIRQD